MGARVPPAVGFVAGLAISLAIAESCFSQPAISRGQTIEGFGKLLWGASVEQATGIYRDLYFGNYVLEGGGREPSKVYYRKHETAAIDDVAFDSIEYWFRDDRFFKIRAVMRSGIGPRSLVTRSEESFTLLHRALVRKYGEPTKYDESYFADFVTVVRVARWDRNDARIVLEYKGPERTNEDRLTLEVREGGRH